MNTLQKDDKVIYTDTNDNEWDAVIRDLPITAIDGEEMVVISMDGGWPIYVPSHRVRKPLDRVQIAKQIVGRWKSINKLRESLDQEYAEIQKLMRQDGQPGSTLVGIADMQITQRNVLRYESRAELGNWEGYLQARQED